RIEEIAVVGGVTMRLADTAGIRETSDPVEAMGVRLAQEAAERAELVMLVLDGSQPWPMGPWARLSRGPLIVVLNKRDLGERLSVGDVLERMPGAVVCEVSLVTGEGFGVLRSRLVSSLAGCLESRQAEVFSTTQRQRQALFRLRECLSRVRYALEVGLSAEFLAADLRPGLRELDQILGLDVTEDVLDRVFSSFCLGK
ncbi:MAG: hypothetical protein AB1758_26330, partial [Candidatus Eremiobacterota bacterium]